MKYDFDKVWDRRNTDSLKWDVKENELPMWVADMDFRTAPEITEALREKIDEGIYGYSILPDSFYDSYINWWSTRHGFDIKKDWIVYSTGVIPTISSSVRKLTSPGEYVLIQTPCYNIFFNSIVNNGRFVKESPLIEVKEKDSNGFYRIRYEIDFTDLENKLSDPQVTMMILCNPHNPTGRIWSRDELTRIASLCKKNGVTVVSDEIHCDITEPGKVYVPFASVSETAARISITAIAPTKCFNLAGIPTSAAVVPDKFLRHRVWRQLNTDECGEPDHLAVAAVNAAFGRGEEWLRQMCVYVSRNRRKAEDFIRNQIPEITPVHADATYLLWMDCRDIWKKLESAGVKSNTARFIRKKTGLYLADGSTYGKAGEGFLRMNLACPSEYVDDGLRRLKAGIRAAAEISHM